MHSLFRNTDLYKFSLVSSICALFIALFFILEIQVGLFLLFFISLAVVYLYINNWHLKDHFVVVFLVFCSILIPPLQLPGSLPEIRLEELIAFLILPFFILVRKERINESAFRFAKYYAIFLGLVVFSLLFGKFFLSVPTGMRDYLEIIKLSKYLIIVLAVSTFEIKNSQIKFILYSITAIFALSAIIGQFQFYSILSFNKLTAPYYLQERIYDIHNRMMGTFYNPNTYGTALSIGAIIATSSILDSKYFFTKVLNFIALCLLIYTLFLTQSRTALGVLVIGLFVLIVLTQVSKRGSLGFTILLIGALFLLLMGIVAILSPDLLKRYQSMLDIMNDPSWLMRLFSWYINLEIFSQSPIFGWGPAKHLYTNIVDNEYILILRQYGIAGFAMNVLALYIYPLWFALKNSFVNNEQGRFSRVFISSLLVFIIANITNSLLHEIQFMDFWAVLLGLLFSISFSSNDQKVA